MHANIYICCATGMLKTHAECGELPAQMLRRDAQESNRNKQTLVLYLYPKVRGGESDAKFYEESNCECCCAAGRFCWCGASVEC